MASIFKSAILQRVLSAIRAPRDLFAWKTGRRPRGPRTLRLGSASALAIFSRTDFDNDASTRPGPRSTVRLCHPEKFAPVDARSCSNQHLRVGFVRCPKIGRFLVKRRVDERYRLSVFSRRLRKGTSSAGSIEGHPKIAGYGSQRMCRSCGAITPRKAILLGVWRVAASSLAAISAAAAPEAAYDRPVRWFWLAQAMTRKPIPPSKTPRTTWAQ